MQYGFAMPHPQEPADAQNSDVDPSELTAEQRAEIFRLARNLASHTGPWARWEGGTEVGLNHVQMPYVVWGSDMSDFARTVQRSELIVHFNWSQWVEGSTWMRNPAADKYDGLTVEFILKLFTALIRSDRFHEGALLAAFDDGTVPKLVQRLMELLAD